VYWFDGTDKTKHEQAMRLFEDAYAHPESFVVSTQNIRELCSVLLAKKRINPTEIRSAVRSVRNMFRHILSDSAFDAEHAVTISSDTGTYYWDALLAATMQRNGITRIVTENTRDFDKIHFLKAVNPLEK